MHQYINNAGLKPGLAHMQTSGLLRCRKQAGGLPVGQQALQCFWDQAA